MSINNADEKSEKHEENKNKEEKKNKEATFKTLYDTLTNSYSFRYNEVTNQLEYKLLLEQEFKHLNDIGTNSIWRRLRQLGINVTKSELTQWINSDLTEIYNPFKQYFETLPEYTDDQADHIRDLANTITVGEEDQQLWYDWFTKWLIAVVACAINEKDINQTALIFVGPQGIGKTSWLKRLTPESLKKYYFGGTINPNNKDTIIQLAECLFINMDELENLNRTDVGNLKEIITKPSVRIRRPYAQTSENMPRRASFMGSVNNIDFLNDPTGTRRFLVFETLGIVYEHDINMDLVYSQAYSLLRKGTQFWFDTKEGEQISERNERFKAISAENEVISYYFTKCLRNEKADLELTTLQVIKMLMDLNTQLRLNPKSIGSALKSLNFDRTKRKGLWYWRLNNRAHEEEIAE